MWSNKELEYLQPESVQKRIPFAASRADVSNFIGNMSLNPNLIPTTLRSKYILQAITRELIISKKIKLTDKTVIIPEEITSICSSPKEMALLTLDSLKLPDFCDLKQSEKSDILATLIQIHPSSRIVKGLGIIDFELSEKQSIHFTSQQLILIPVPQLNTLTITIALTQGDTRVGQRIPIKIPKSILGLIIDTRDTDILINSQVASAKELVGSWMKSLDIVYNEG